jgi:hypothetical protein
VNIKYDLRTPDSRTEILKTVFLPSDSTWDITNYRQPPIKTCRSGAVHIEVHIELHKGKPPPRAIRLLVELVKETRTGYDVRSGSHVNPTDALPQLNAVHSHQILPTAFKFLALNHSILTITLTKW